MPADSKNSNKRPWTCSLTLFLKAGWTNAFQFNSFFHYAFLMVDRASGYLHPTVTDNLQWKTWIPTLEEWMRGGFRIRIMRQCRPTCTEDLTSVGKIEASRPAFSAEMHFCKAILQCPLSTVWFITEMFRLNLKFLLLLTTIIIFITHPSLFSLLSHRNFYHCKTPQW